jgi:hypothetical protein
LGTSPCILEYGFLNDFSTGPLYEMQDGCISYNEKTSWKARNMKHLESQTHERISGQPGEIKEVVKMKQRTLK